MSVKTFYIHESLLSLQKGTKIKVTCSMNDDDTKRLSRLTAILTQLQTKRILTSTTLAERFGVNVRTIYRDIKSIGTGERSHINQRGKVIH